MDAARLREQFPVFEHCAYLNAGTCGPLPAPALRAGADSALRAAQEGRAKPYFETTQQTAVALRGAYAEVLGGADPTDVALTTGTSQGLTEMLGALRLAPGDEILTAGDEHPGLLGPLGAARRHLGVTVRTAPLAELVEAVDPARTKLVACSHVSWMTGALAPPELAQVGRDIPVLLDGAQGAGAVEFDVTALGCFAYAAAGQKWLCGPVGSGLLWVDPAWRERLAVLAPTYGNLADAASGLDAEPHPDARAFDADALSQQTLAVALASAQTFADAGWPAVFERARTLSATLATQVADPGREVAPRGQSTLVSFQQPDPEATVARAAEAGVTIRALPGTPYVRASVGAWNDERDLERLLAVL